MMNRQRSRPILAVFLLATAFLPHQMQAATDSPTGLKLLASNKDDRNNFGYSVSISNDTALVGSKSACWYLGCHHAGTGGVSKVTPFLPLPRCFPCNQSHKADIPLRCGEGRASSENPPVLTRFAP